MIIRPLALGRDPGRRRGGRYHDQPADPITPSEMFNSQLRPYLSSAVFGQVERGHEARSRGVRISPGFGRRRQTPGTPDR